MSKELEALEDIILFLNAKEPKGLYCENIEIIKTALKRLEKIENIMPIDKPELLKPSIDIVNKKLKALEIIKWKKVDIQLLDRSYITCAFDYNNEFDDKKYHLTQEEYDLLKEVFYEIYS